MFSGSMRQLFAKSTGFLPSLDGVCSADPKIPLVVSFSGGRTSGLMLRMILDAGHKPIVLFANTGKERDETLEFVHAVETQWSVPVVWLQYTRIPTDKTLTKHLKTERMRSYAESQQEMHWFRVVDHSTAHRHDDDNGPFDELIRWMSVLPNTRVRACTAQMKIRTMQRYLWSRGVYKFRNAIGFRADEYDRAIEIQRSPDRDMDVSYWFPLAEAGADRNDVREFWKRQHFDLGLEDYEGNCHLCFLKKKAAKQRLILEQPELSQWWENAESTKRQDPKITGDGWRWRKEKGHSIRELREAARSNAKQMTLGIDDSPMECSCTAGNSLGDAWDESC